MGVTGLWKLLEPCGKEVPVETLEGKVLAVDISIWLHQVVKGFQDNKGNALANAHLLGLFNRLCKLLYYRVRPVFIFDGSVPQLKRETIARRQQQRGKLSLEADRIQNLLIQSLAKEKAVQDALGANAENLLKSSPLKRMANAARAEDAVDDMFKLPELPGTSAAKAAADGGQAGETEGDSSYTTEGITDTEDSSFDESNPRYNYDTNLQAIDVRSQHFRNLPVEVRHEILVDIKETRKHSWGRMHELPANSNEFSTFQMKRLLKRRAVQESLEEVQQEMGGRSLTYAELMNFFTEEGIVAPSSVMENAAKPICSDESTRFLLVRDLKKKLTEESQAPGTSTGGGRDNIKKERLEPIKEQDDEPPKKMEKKEVEEPPKVIEKKEVEEPSKVIEKNEEELAKAIEKIEEDTLGREYDLDLQLALAMSLEDDDDVYRPEDYEYESDKQLRLNRQQRQQLQMAAVGPARAYMIEYGGMNDEEVVGIMEETQVDVDKRIEELIAETTPPGETEAHESPAEQKENIAGSATPVGAPAAIQVDSDTDTDSDLEEVPVVMPESESTADRKPEPKRSMEIVLDMKEPLTPQDDLFADIFEEAVKVEEPNEQASTSSKAVASDEHPKMEQTLETAKKTEGAMASILAELKQQADEAQQINLADIQVDSSIIELSDEEAVPPPASTTPTLTQEETIGIDTPRKQLVQQPLRSAGKSAKFQSPSSKSILEYFDTDYVVKRTPEKPAVEEDVPKVRSPFFINKTPKSRGSNTSSPVTTPSQRGSKVSKTLFGDSPVDATAAPAPKEQKSEAELQAMAGDLAQRRRQLEAERNRQDRMGMSISQRMNAECQELLRLFGVPYIVAPMEAEAQCAFLDTVQLTNGTITDDSDIWLFGGHTVYKNFFALNKHVLEFRADKIEQSLNCDRRRLIQLACLVGSDYTNGVHGIGTVTALEILASFTPPKESQSGGVADDSNTRASLPAVLSTLSRFRDWWEEHKASAAPPGSSVRLALRKKLKNIELDEGFPSMAVVEAYLLPTVDNSEDAFSWGAPDVESIREFAKKNFGWTSVKTDEILMPVLKKLNEKKSQASIKNYFAVKSALTAKQHELKVSKRVQNAISKLAGQAETEPAEKPKPAGRRRKRKQPADATSTAEAKKQAGEASMPAVDEVASEPSTSKAAATRSKRVDAVAISTATDVIPQREKTRAQMLKNKQNAAEVFKKSTRNKK